MNSRGVFCADCVHRRAAGRPTLYTADGAANPAVVRAWGEWHKELVAAELAERERYQLGAPFPFKPMFLSWCAWWTARNNADPALNHLGEPVLEYALTARHNASHDCSAFHPRRDEEGG